MQVIILLSILGALDSLYTALQQKFPQLWEFCFNWNAKRVSCKEILHSKYARIFKIAPNSWLGIVTYLLLSLVYYLADFYTVIGATRLFYVGASIATLGLIVSYYLLYVQAFILKKFCIFCLASTTIMTVITVLAWMRVT